LLPQAARLTAAELLAGAAQVGFRSTVLWPTATARAKRLRATDENRPRPAPGIGELDLEVGAHAGIDVALMPLAKRIMPMTP
jgi:hypothetical protein